MKVERFLRCFSREQTQARCQREFPLPKGFVLTGALAGNKAPTFVFGGCMKYRCEATSVEGFVQILASNYLPHGYWFYVTGRVPPGKAAGNVDKKLIDKYGIALSRQQRSRRKQDGHANLHYVRFEDFFVLLATHGQHPFFLEEAKSVRDIRKYPLHFSGYSISVKRGQFLKKEENEAGAKADSRLRVRVQIARDRYQELLGYFGDTASHRSAERLSQEMWRLPFEPYAPVRKQMLQILRHVNSKRKAIGFELITPDVIRYRRRIVKPFEPVKEAAAA